MPGGERGASQGDSRVCRLPDAGTFEDAVVVWDAQQVVTHDSLHRFERRPSETGIPLGVTDVATAISVDNRARDRVLALRIHGVEGDEAPRLLQERSGITHESRRLLVVEVVEHGNCEDEVVPVFLEPQPGCIADVEDCPRTVPLSRPRNVESVEVDPRVLHTRGDMSEQLARTTT